MGMEMGKQEMRRRAAPLRRCTPTAAANRQAGNWLGGLRPASGEAATRRGLEDRSRRVAPSVVAPGSVRHRRGRRTRDADGGRECRRAQRGCGRPARSHGCARHRRGRRMADGGDGGDGAAPASRTPGALDGGGVERLRSKERRECGACCWTDGLPPTLVAFGLFGPNRLFGPKIF